MRYDLLKRVSVLLTAAVLSLSFASCKKAPIAASKKINVLFIGNSLTFVNDLPGLTASLAKSRNFILEYTMFAPGGYTLAQHSSNPELLQKIKEGNWDFVVLQEQSQIPAYPWAQTQVLPYARKLTQLIRDSAPAAKVAFYVTMARRNGDQQGVQFAPEVATYYGMQKKLIETYAQMAMENKGVLVPVGNAWQEVRTQIPSLNLYSDDVHPNLTGTYLAACVFYGILFDDTPVGLTHPMGIDDHTADELQRYANNVLKPAEADAH